MVVPADYLSKYLRRQFLGRKVNMRIDSLAAHTGVLDDEFEGFLATGETIKVRSWYNNMGMNVQTHIDAEITWIFFEETCAPLKWAQLPIDHIICWDTAEEPILGSILIVNSIKESHTNRKLD